MKSIGIALTHYIPEDKKSVPIKEQIENGAEEPKPHMELHINIWKIMSGFLGRKSRFYIDFGMKVNPYYNKIWMCLPFKLNEKESWIDLGKGICNNDELLRAIFNEEYCATCQSNSCYYEISDPNKEEYEKDKHKFYFYLLGSENVKIHEGPDDKSTRLEIDIHDVKSTNKKDYYIRFRLYIKDTKEFCKSRNLSNEMIQSAFSKLDLYDLRINQKRNMDMKDKEFIKNKDAVLAEFSKVHILYIANAKVSVESGSCCKIGSRLIEPDLWKDYEPKKMKRKLCIAHHWKFEPKSNSKDTNDIQEMNKAINLFYIAKYPLINFATLSAYFGVVILLGMAGSWLSNTSILNGASIDLKFWIIIGIIGYLFLRWFWNIRADVDFYIKET